MALDIADLCANFMPRNTIKPGGRKTIVWCITLYEIPNHNSTASCHFGPIVEVVAVRTAKVLCLNECANHGPCVERECSVFTSPWRILKEYRGTSVVSHIDILNWANRILVPIPSSLPEPFTNFLGTVNLSVTFEPKWHPFTVAAEPFPPGWVTTAQTSAPSPALIELLEHCVGCCTIEILLGYCWYSIVPSIYHVGCCTINCTINCTQLR